MEINELQQVIKNHRWAGLWNGVVIGMGVGYLLSGLILGALPIAMGLDIEILQRKKLTNYLLELITRVNCVKSRVY